MLVISRQLFGRLLADLPELSKVPITISRDSTVVYLPKMISDTKKRESLESQQHTPPRKARRKVKKPELPAKLSREWFQAVIAKNLDISKFSIPHSHWPDVFEFFIPGNSVCVFAAKSSSIDFGYFPGKGKIFLAAWGFQCKLLSSQAACDETKPSDLQDEINKFALMWNDSRCPIAACDSKILFIVAPNPGKWGAMPYPTIMNPGTYCNGRVTVPNGMKVVMLVGIYLEELLGKETTDALRQFADQPAHPGLIRTLSSGHLFSS
eukprot:TRINITY_DN7_c0_g2_i15.p1 TRINITY_DN7_c0_g2~~TRINITY_DN7_c0_g2_i15.p1  ORF type:complete len:265 (-),score=44.29 TRINITY_DN7_c0_g2_i15:77-871(-)